MKSLFSFQKGILDFMKPYSGFGKFQGPSETCRWNTVLDFEKRCHVPVRKWFDDDLNTGCTGKFFKSLTLFSDFKCIWISRQKLDTKLLKNGMFHSTQIKNDRFSAISNGQNLSFSQIWQAEMSVLAKPRMSFWRKNSNVEKINPKHLTFKKVPPLQDQKLLGILEENHVLP